jgi:hypothetical protein
MNTNSLIRSQASENGFDLFRLSKAKETVGVCANTLRMYNLKGLPFYRRGKVVFVSKSDLDAFIRAGPVTASAPQGGAAE